MLIEEFAFRGVLLALTIDMYGTVGAIALTSFLFGLWHILPSMGIGQANAAVGETIGTNPWVTTTAAVLSMTVAGVLMCVMARLGKGIKTTMLLHWATNSLGFFAAWLLLQ